MKFHKYFVYILTNSNKTTLYIGVTNDLNRRLNEHKYDSENLKQTFAGKYNCIYLLYTEEFQWIQHAIDRETELKKWSRTKKLELIKQKNPNFDFLNKW